MNHVADNWYSVVQWSNHDFLVHIHDTSFSCLFDYHPRVSHNNRPPQNPRSTPLKQENRKTKQSNIWCHDQTKLYLIFDSW